MDKARIFLIVDLQTLEGFYCNFLESRKKNSTIVFEFYLPTLNIICFVEKNDIFLRFCLCIFESGTVKSDCPVQSFRNNDEIFKDLTKAVSVNNILFKYKVHRDTTNTSQYNTFERDTGNKSRLV